MKIETIEGLAKAGNGTTLAGAAVGGIGAFMASNFVGIAGLVIALAGLAVNLYYRAKANKRHELEHQLRVARLRKGMDSDTDLGELGADE